MSEDAITLPLPHGTGVLVCEQADGPDCTTATRMKRKQRRGLEEEAENSDAGSVYYSERVVLEATR